MRIAYIGWTEPGSVSGATLALQRHLFGDEAWEVLVVTDKLHKGVGPRDRWKLVGRSCIQQRLSRTRLRRWVAQYEMVIEPYRIAKRIEKMVRDFAPDVIHTIPDNTLSWTARLVARRLGVPLVTNFQDWWPRGQFYAGHEAPFLPVRSILERRFRIMFRDSRVAFCTSRGFQRYLGKHPQAPVLLPCPADRPQERPDIQTRGSADPVRLTYGGTLVGHYGRMLLALAREVAQRPEISLELYGGRPDWSETDLAWANEKRIYRGSLSPEAYRRILERGDVFLTVMTHAQELRIMMETSFTTKFLEYCQFGRPVIVWGPYYCEPIRVAQDTGAGIAVTTPSPAAVVEAALQLRDPKRDRCAGDAAWAAAITIFDPTEIQQVFRRGLEYAISTGRKTAGKAAKP